MRPLLPIVVLFSLTGVACGGTDDGRFSYEETDTTAPDPCEVGSGYELLSVLDFEPRRVSGGVSAQLACNPDLPSSCSFYFNYDNASSPPNPALFGADGADCAELVDEGTEVTTQPRIGSNIESEAIPGGRCGQDGSALHIVTENVGMCYGADGRLGWGAALDVTFAGPPLDASEWDGFAFWVKKSEGSSKPAFIAQFVDPNTSGAENPDTGEPSCDASEPATGPPVVPDSEKCDSFGTAITLTDDWSFVAARFEDLAQKGFGVVSPLGHLKVDEINRMQIFMNAGSADFWIDDLSLFRETE